jgi:3-hydroxymyristoyl/3-hydroxydecanoyl-(acyl carrier protein) dehydratase
MFELIDSITIDADAGQATGHAVVDGNHQLFADHFPGETLLPGSLLVELAAQIAGPLAEEVVKQKRNLDRWALLGMIRDVKFVRPVGLPATITINAEVRRFEVSNVAVSVTATAGDDVAMTGEVVMMMVEAKPEWKPAIEARSDRLSAWKASQ